MPGILWRRLLHLRPRTRRPTLDGVKMIAQSFTSSFTPRRLRRFKTRQLSTHHRGRSQPGSLDGASYRAVAMPLQRKSPCTPSTSLCRLTAPAVAFHDGFSFLFIPYDLQFLLPQPVIRMRTRGVKCNTLSLRLPAAFCTAFGRSCSSLLWPVLLTCGRKARGLVTLTSRRIPSWSSGEPSGTCSSVPNTHGLNGSLVSSHKTICCSALEALPPLKKTGASREAVMAHARLLSSEAINRFADGTP